MKMAAIDFLLISLLSTGFLFAGTNSLCTFPSDLDGVFDSTHETSQLTFNSTHVYPFEVDTQSFVFSNLNFECNIKNGSYYVARSVESFTIYTVPYYVYTCWVFAKQNSNVFVQYQATSKLSTAANRNYHIYPITFSVDSNTICDVSAPYTGDTVSLLVKNATASSAKSDCPTALWGKYVYQLTDTSGTTYCDYTSWLDVCTSTSTLSVNTTLCSSTTLYSSGGTLYCMFSLQDSSDSDTYYVYLYNDDTSVDSSTTYRFTCLVMKYASNVTYMTQYPNECLNSTTQTYSLMTTSPGGFYTMFANVTCPPSSDSGLSIAAIVAIVVILLIIIIVVIVFVIYYYQRIYLRKKRDRLSSKISPDGIPIPVSAMTADTNFRMMYTPGPPKSAVPERRRAREAQRAANAGSRAASAASFHPTVSALAGYRTPTPFVSDCHDIDVDSFLDFDYTTTKQTLGEPDGEESGVMMLELEGSLPVYSEAGDTPEPTRRTPVGQDP